ncbi:unnamed protein product [Ilex paraguariensis]|uniref:BTB domain-containing protein n=1 Tax=Ilex paraguariensis TaxID=185542 RepID=A0ABC8RWI1_9AQUA
MENQRSHGHEQPASSVRRSLKRKLEEDLEENRKIVSISLEDHQDLSREVLAQVEVLDSTFSSIEADRASAKRAIHVLSELAKNEEIVNVIVDCGAVPVLVRHLQAPPPLREGDTGPKPYEHEIEKGSAFTLGLLAIKPDHQQIIVDAGALPRLVDLLKRHRDGQNSRAVNGVIRRAADAITNLAHENSSIKTRVRIEGGIPPLVELLDFVDTKVQRAAAGALRTLAFKNDENKNQIVECNALPTLILMLRSEDAAIHYEAVGVIGNLVHSSPNIKKEVLVSGALQPVIGLLSSCCSESQREAALLLGQFAATDSDCKVHIVQRGAVQPLIEMLQSPDAQLREMAAFALGRLAQDTHNQAGIAHSGGVIPLLKLLDSKNGSLQHNAAFALYGLADNEDNVADLIRIGGVQKLQDGEFIVQPTRDCVAKTLKRLEEKIHGRVLSHLLYLMRVAEKVVQRRVALALAHLCLLDDQKTVFIDSNGLELLLELLESTNLKHQRDGSVALYKLANKASSLSPVDAAPPSPVPQSQREAALLLGQFAATDSDCKVHIVQRGAVQPLIEMLQSPDAQLREMAAFALGRLAQDTHNQAGIAHSGGVIPLLKLLDSKNGSLQHNAAFALYGLADNEDNVADLIRIGGVQKLQDGEFIVQPTRDCVAKTLKRLEEKIHGRVLSHLLYLMRVAEKVVQRRVALALAHLCLLDDQKTVFIDSNGLELLLELLESTNLKHQRDGSVALYKLANKASSLSPVDAAPPSPVPQVYLGEQFVNNATLSDVTFLIEGKRFYAHRICLLASSDAFRAMFDGGYRTGTHMNVYLTNFTLFCEIYLENDLKLVIVVFEVRAEKDAKDIEIPNIKWDVFELMMRYIYTGSVAVNLDIAQDLLRAADQYLLEGLKRLCEYTIAKVSFEISWMVNYAMYEYDVLI